MSKSITIVGMGMGNPDLLTKEARCALLDADLIMGSRRLKEALPGNCQAPFYEIGDGKEFGKLIDKTEAENIVICMSGDSGFYSGTNGLLAFLEKKYEVAVLPGISCISYLAARAMISWQDACVVSLHGRKENWACAVRNHEKTFILMGGSLRSFVEKLCLAGFGHCRLIIGIRLSYGDEKILSATASALFEKGEKLDIWDSSLCAVFVLNSRVGRESWIGMPDSAFFRGQVPMTKSEVRAVTMSRLRLKEDDIVYDIGAGTGSVSVEMSMQAWKGTVYAIEHNENALELIRANKEKFMAENIEIVKGKATEVLKELPQADAAFIGGSKGDKEEIIELLLKKNPSMHMVMNVISLESLGEILETVKKFHLKNLEITQVSVARGREIAGQHLMDGMNPVFVVTVDGSMQEEGKPC